MSDGLVTNFCVIATPRPRDDARIRRVIARIARIGGGEPVTVPHVSLAYFAEVSETDAACVIPNMARLCRDAAPLAFQATRLIREPNFFPDFPGALIFEIRQTAAMLDLHSEILRRAEENCLARPRFAGAAWRAHITALYTSNPTAAALDRIDALAPELHFAADELRLSHRVDAHASWDEVGVYPLLG